MPRPSQLDEQRAQLEGFARSRSLPHALARRAKIILLAADGLSNSAICEKLDVTNPTITKWCKRFSEHGLEGIYDVPSTGRARTYDDEEVAQLMQQALEQRPVDGASILPFGPARQGVWCREYWPL